MLKARRREMRVDDLLVVLLGSPTRKLIAILK